MNRNTRTLIVLLVAIATAGAATFLVYQAIQRRPVQQVANPKTFVVAAAKPLQTGVLLTATDVKLVGWPSDAIVPGSFTKVEDVVGRGVLNAMSENEPLTDTKVAPVGAGAGLPPTIPPGMRAISLRVNDVVGVAGFVTPGNRVDVFVTLKRNDTSLTRIVLSNVQVLTAGTAFEQDKSKTGQAMPTTVVTLLLSPEDAEKVVLAATEGQIMLALRNPLDVQEVKTTGARLASLYGDVTAASAPQSGPAAPQRASRPRPVAPPVVAPPPPPAPKPYMVEAIRGAKRSEETIR
jgi:pilus assembly protein CpaB